MVAVKSRFAVPPVLCAKVRNKSRNAAIIPASIAARTHPEVVLGQGTDIGRHDGRRYLTFIGTSLLGFRNEKPAPRMELELGTAGLTAGC
jgi:hypothetical protein